MNVQFSRHARSRASQRGLTEDEISFVFHFGRHIHRTGIRFVFLAHRDVPSAYRRTHGHLAGCTVLVSHDGTVLTMYKNQAALSVIKKKDKRSRHAA
jgi:hypothetical protein